MSTATPTQNDVRAIDLVRRGQRLRRALAPLPPRPRNPALLKHVEERAEHFQSRTADRITAFAGSMAFVYLHVIWFGLWIEVIADEERRTVQLEDHENDELLDVSKQILELTTQLHAAARKP